MSLITGGAAERIEARVAALLSGNNQFTGDNQFTGANTFDGANDFLQTTRLRVIELGTVGAPASALLRMVRSDAPTDQGRYRLSVENDGRLRILTEEDSGSAFSEVFRASRSGAALQDLRLGALTLPDTSLSMTLDSGGINRSDTYTMFRAHDHAVIWRNSHSEGGPASGGSTMTLATLPAAFRPSVDVRTTCVAVNGGVLVLAHALVKANGVIEMRLGLMAGPPGDEWLAFTGARDWQGTHGLPGGFFLSYRL